jgi:2-phosphosulfolactate phosphatase
MEIRLASLESGAAAAQGTVVIIDVFRAFTTAAIAFSGGADRILMVEGLEQALTLRREGRGQLAIGERGGARPPGFDFANSPTALSVADVAGKVLIQSTSNGTKGLAHAHRAERLYAGALVTAEATVQAILRANPALVTIVAMGRADGMRADEDEFCALYLRSRLQGRQPDKAALRRIIESLVPPIEPDLIARGDYDPRDREIALETDRVPFAIRVRPEQGLLVAEPER